MKESLQWVFDMKRFQHQTFTGRYHLWGTLELAGVIKVFIASILQLTFIIWHPLHSKTLFKIDTDDRLTITPQGGAAFVIRPRRKVELILFTWL